MESLKKRVLKAGKATAADILQVDSFLNHMVDIELLHEIGKEFAEIFKEVQPTKIITVESSGIPFAAISALELKIPFIIAKKYSSLNLTSNAYATEVFSYTKQKRFNVCVSKELISCDDRFLIIDDFLAFGGAVNGLIQIINEANSSLVGVGICIEKTFQKGANDLLLKGVNLHSLVKVKSLEGGNIVLH